MNLVPLKLFVGKTMSTMQPEIAGARLSNIAFLMKHQQHIPRIGQTGTFVYQASDKKALATIPVTIESITEMGPCMDLTVTDMSGVGYRLKLNEGMDLQTIAEVGGKFLMPKSFKWMPMEGFEQVSNSGFDYVSKTAATKLSATPVKIISTGAGQYAMKGLNKYADAIGWVPDNLHGYQLKFILSSLGATQEKIAKIMKIADKSGQAEVHGLKFLPLKSEKIAQALPKARKLAAVAEKLKCNLVKEASFIKKGGPVENTQTVDALLSLNFVNPENVSKFVGKISSFKAAISNLASCLMASRLGMQEIPETATSTAMYRLIDVVNGLEALRATQEGMDA